MSLRKFAMKQADDLVRRLPLLTRRTWKTVARTVPLFEASLNNLTHPLWGRLFRKLARLESKAQKTQAFVVPINRELDYLSQGVVAPIEKIQEVIGEASFRAVMDRCICRDGYSCKDYPRDLGCLQLGEAARTMVKRGIAHEVGLDEALAHLENAAQLGLVAVCAWVEVESLLLGVSEKDHERYLEICLCCPCCCIAMRSFKNIFHDKHLRGRFSTTGWRARGMDGCTDCGKCADVCPMDAVIIGNGGVTVLDQCIGCGHCATHCPVNAIVMDAIAPMKDRIQDYFQGLDMKLGG